MQRFISLLVAFFCLMTLNAQQVTNVKVVKNGDNAIITYDLSGDKPGQTFEIKVECAAGNKKPFLISSLALSGDLDGVTAGNGKKIEFHALDDLNMMVGDNFMFQLVASEIIKPKPIEAKLQETEKKEVEKVDSVFQEDGDSAEIVDMEDDPIFIIVEEPATFRGSSLDSFRTWVSQNMLYPLIAAENGIQGKVYVQFVVNKNGEVIMVKVIRGVDPALDNESVRVISSSPKWVPAKQGGKVVNQQFVIPLSFVLEDSESSKPTHNVIDSIGVNREATNIEGDEKAKEVIIEEPATFQGGDLNKFRVWVSQNMVYPEIAAKNGVQGKVYVQFAVNSKGDVVDVTILRSVDPAIDKESIRVITSSPKWTPAKQDGKNVKQQFVIPLSFALQ